MNVTVQLQVINKREVYIYDTFNHCRSISYTVFDFVNSDFFVEWLIGKVNKDAKDISSLRIVQWAFKVITRLSGVSVTVIGEENIPDEAVLFIGNHRSYFDIVLTYSRCKRLTGYVAKKRFKSSFSLCLDAISLLSFLRS